VSTVYRNNYLMALKALSQNRVTGALLRVIDFAQRYTADRFLGNRARLILDRTHAFTDPNEADAAGVRLVLPTPEVVADVTWIPRKIAALRGDMPLLLQWPKAA
jgi:hypothetical protein